MTMARGLFDEPLDAPGVIAMLTHDERFLWNIYFALMFARERWPSTIDQVKRLFIECMRQQISDHKLYEISALMFVWAGRFRDRKTVVALRNEMVTALDFIDQSRMRKLVVSCQPTPSRPDERLWRGQI